MKTLLVLDDELQLLKLLGSVLRRQYAVIESTTAEQALCLFAEHGSKIDLLVADVTLPTSSGIKVAALMRLLSPGLPVVLISGYPLGAWGERDGADLKSLGSNLVAIIQKPFQSRALLNAVRELTECGGPEIARTA